MIIGVTGSLATGKSTAAKYLASFLKGHLIDADRLAHSALSRKSTAYRKVVSIFGKEILDRKGSVDKKRLAKKAFCNKANLRKLCSIVHPVVIKRIKISIDDIYKKNSLAFIVLDAPVLIEAGLHKRCDTLIVVVSSLILQLERSQHAKRLKPEDSLLRIRSQMPLYKKAAYADYIIDNNGSLRELKQRCRRLASELKGVKRW